MNNQTIENENVFYKLKINSTAFTVLFIFMVLIIISLFILFNSSFISQNKNSLSFLLFTIISFVLLSLALAILFIPYLQNIYILLKQIKNTIYFLIYSIFLILLFGLLPNSFLSNNSNIILPISILFAIILFYFAFKTNYIMDFNINYEKIKIIFLFFSLISLILLYYLEDPGGMLKKNSGYSTLLLFLLQTEWLPMSFFSR
jgi:hypothetical protein